MPNATNNKKGEQWDLCDRCGMQFPMSRLGRHQGMLVCDRKTCRDNLQVEHREEEIQHLLNMGVEVEGADLRSVDRGFFVSQDDEVTG